MNNQNEKRSFFTSKFGLVAAAAGSAVGLGNIWKFPYEMGVNGGGAFLLVYVICVVLLGLPVMLSEMVIGRAGHANASRSFVNLSKKKIWSIVGLIGIASSFFVLSFYFVVAGWSFEYIYQAVMNAFEGQTPAQLSQAFSEFSTLSYRPLIWLVLCMAITAYVILGGVKDGIEKFSKWLMPLLFLLLVVLGVRSLTMENATEGLKFMFNPDFSKITPRVVLSALGQAFFSLSLGMSAMITYGSYMNKQTRLGSTALQVTVVDTLVAILAGIVIFPAVFSLNIQPDQGPSLVFVTLPSVFAQMPGGYLFAILFFVLLAVAAITSTISLFEVITVYISEEFNLKRRNVVIGVALTLTATGVLSAFSLMPDSSLVIADKSLFDLFDAASSRFLMPIAALLISIFAGWFMGKDRLKHQLTNEGSIKAIWFNVFFFLVRYLVPIAILIILFNQLGFFNQ